MRYFLLSALLLTCASCAVFSPNRTLTLANNGTARMTIVTPDKMSPACVTARDELINHLNKITGASFKIVKESKFTTSHPAIYLGATTFARQHGINVDNLKREEWVIRAIGDSLIISGGEPAGTLIAVYEFLENVLGCHWLAWNCDIIPRKDTLTIPPLNLKGQPAFERRIIYRPPWYRSTTKGIRPLMDKQTARNRGTLEDNPRYGGIPRVLPRCHSFYLFVDPKKYFKNHPEYYSLNEKGERFCGVGSQLCLTNQDVRRIVLENLRKKIKKNDITYSKKGLEKPRIYEISQEDRCKMFCRCPQCASLSKREGSDAGPLLDFINYIAKEIAKDYPDMKIRTFGYVSTEIPPKTIKPRDNVIIQYCDLYSRSDCYRPLQHPVNTVQAQKIKAWQAIAPSLHLWDYWNLGDAIPRQSCPATIPVSTIAADAKFLHSNHVKDIFAQAEEGVTCQNFFELQNWAGLQLYNNPELSPEKLLDTFMKGYYGPASKNMREFYDLLVNAQNAETTPMLTGPYPIFARSYLTLSFLVRCRSLLKEAEKQCAPDSVERIRVLRELVVVDNCLLSIWKKLKKQNGNRMPFSKSEIIKEYQHARTAVLKVWYDGEKLEEQMRLLKAELDVLNANIPLPKQFKHKKEVEIIDFPAIRFRNRVADDSESCCGKAKAYRDPNPQNHLKLAMFGLYDRTQKRFGPQLVIKDPPKDEKYHLHKIGEFNLGPNSIVWGHWKWNITIFLESAFVDADGVEGTPNLWDVYVSAKITGPAYVKNSKKENAIWIDRVILVKPDKSSSTQTQQNKK